MAEPIKTPEQAVLIANAYTRSTSGPSPNRRSSHAMSRLVPSGFADSGHRRRQYLRLCPYSYASVACWICQKTARRTHLAWVCDGDGVAGDPAGETEDP